MTLTAEYLRTILDYDPDSGLLSWRVKRGSINPGDTAGCLDLTSGYIRVFIDGSLHRAHRLAWLHVTGHWPENIVDHIDGDCANNKWINLRQATCQQNRANTRRKGATLDKRLGKWQSRIVFQGQRLHLGHYATEEEASAAHAFAARLIHGGYAWTGRG